MPHKRALERVHPRAEKRLAISADSAEREAQGLSPNPLLSQPYPVPKAWLSHFPLEGTTAGTGLLETEKEDRSGGHAGERSGQSDALQWNDTQATSSTQSTSSTHATSTSASSANGSTDIGGARGEELGPNAETTLDEELGE